MGSSPIIGLGEEMSEDLLSTLQAVQPGDHIQISGGTYSGEYDIIDKTNYSSRLTLALEGDGQKYQLSFDLLSGYIFIRHKKESSGEYVDKIEILSK